jgi:hypothetical protein
VNLVLPKKAKEMELQPRSYSKKELCELLGVSWCTIKSWLSCAENKELRQYKGRAFTPKQMDYLVYFLCPEHVYDDFKEKMKQKFSAKTDWTKHSA